MTDPDLDAFVATANGSFCYRTYGPSDGAALLVVNGLGSQLINWPVGFIDALVAEGFFLLAYDNRDIGRSVNWDSVGPTESEIVAGIGAETPVPPAYTLADMASDGILVAEALGHERVAVLGVSMGGMIVQQMAIDHPDRVSSLTSIMSTTGNASVGRSTPQALEALMAPRPAERDAAIEAAIEAAKVWASPQWFDPVDMRTGLSAAWDRTQGFRPDGTARQFAAIIAAPSRDDDLAKLDVPALVVHGTDDTLIMPDGGEHTAAMIPDAELLILEGMGHDLPEVYWATIAERVKATASRARS